MKKNLRLLTLKSLAEKPKAGYGLVKNIKEKTGWKPSYGSIYPLLEEMKKEDLIESRKEGRKKIYTLTRKGKKRISKLEDRKIEIYASMEEDMKVIQELTGEDLEPVIEMMRRMRRNEDPLEKVGPELNEFRNTIFRIALEGKLEKNSQKIRKILKQSTEKLKRVE